MNRTNKLLVGHVLSLFWQFDLLMYIVGDTGHFSTSISDFQCRYCHDSIEKKRVYTTNACTPSKFTEENAYKDEP